MTGMDKEIEGFNEAKTSKSAGADTAAWQKVKPAGSAPSKPGKTAGIGTHTYLWIATGIAALAAAALFVLHLMR
jgi:hypothetical protein